VSTSLQAVLFDYGHTLIRFERPQASLLQAYEQVNELLTERLAREIPTAQELVVGISHAVDDEILRDYAAERLEEVEIASLYDQSLRRLGLELDGALIDRIMELEQQAWLAGVAVGPDVVPLLERLRAAGLKLGLVSNVAFLPRLMHQQLVHLGLKDYFDGLSWSSEVRVRKPHPAIYVDALGKLGRPAAATLFVGDRVREDIRGPQAMGMRAVLLHEWRQEEDPEGIADATITRLGDLWPLIERWRHPESDARVAGVGP